MQVPRSKIGRTSRNQGARRHLRRTLTVALFSGMAALATAAPASAGTYPDRPVTLVVPFPAGAATDILARMMAQKLSIRWHQPVIVENRAGATGSIAAGYVARAPADGYTLLVATSSSHTMGPYMIKTKTWDPVASFAPITILTWAPNVLEVNPSIPAKTVPELIKLLKEHPGKYTFASSGLGSSIQLAGELFKKMAHVQMMHVPYKGAAPALADLLGGQVDMMFDTVAQSLPSIKAGKVRALAVTTKQRSSALPNIPTMAEAGLPGYDMSAWIGLLAPAGTPAKVITRIGDDARELLSEPEVKQRLSELGMEAAPTQAAEFGAIIKKELVQYGELMRGAGIEPQ
ncbi:Bug family tripartite tricarboxylate transporter substrate binding protein [Achromobacter aloeverae]